MSEKWPVALVLGVLLVVGMVHVGALRPGQDWGGDFAMYVAHARNLAEGRPYAETGYVYNPDYATVGPPTYPPVCPLLLAPVCLVYGPDLEAMKPVMIAALLVFLLFVFLVLRKELPAGQAAAIVALVGLNRCFLGDANSIRSDLPFMAILYAAIYVIQKAYGNPDADRPRPGCVLLAALLIVAAYGARTVGIVLLPSLLVYELVRYRRITRWAVAATLLVGAVLAAKSVLVPGDTGYLDQYDVGLGVFLQNGMGYAAEFAAFWHNGYSKPIGAALFAAVTVLAVLGYVSSVRRRVTFLEIFPIFYVLAVLAFPGFAGRRYLQPIFPLYLFYAARGLQLAWLVDRPALRRAAVAAMLLAVAATYAASFTNLQLDFAEGISRPESVALFDYVAQQTEADDVIVFIKPRVMALLTSRRSAAYHMPDDDARLWEFFDRIGATHLVVVDSDEAMALAESPERIEYLRAFARRNAARLAPVFTNRDFSVYRIAEPTALAQGAR
jgi:hypothetical protein